MSLMAPGQRRLIAPEVIQTSAMDCGPASLKCLLDGFGIPVSYGRLREACQTDVDGTSIDTMEEVAMQLGLEAEQIMVPVDHLLLPEAKTLPAIVVIQQPNGLTHFIIVWRRYGNSVQVMDPAVGRRWLSRRELLDQIYRHTMPVPAAAWREWAGSDEFLVPLRRRLEDIGLGSQTITYLLENAVADPTWRGLATLDAVTRMVAALIEARGLRRGAEAGRALHHFLDRTLHSIQAEPDAAASLIPAAYWSVQPVPVAAAAGPADEVEEELYLRGAVLVRALGRREMADADEAPPLSPELAATLAEKPARPLRELWRFLRADGLLAPIFLLAALVFAAGGVLVEALLLRGLLDIGRSLGAVEQRLTVISGIILFTSVLLLLDLPIMSGVLRLGRHLEGRLRLAFLQKIPRLGDRYFQSRLISDMVERSHSVHQLRQLPLMGRQILRLGFELLFTAAGIIWLEPVTAPIAGLAAVVVIGLPLMSQSFLAEQDMRVRTHAGALSRFYFDALLGLIPIRSHGAERVVRREHENLLVEWARAHLRLLRSAITVEGLQALVGFGLAAWLLWTHLAHSGAAGGTLLLIYWALRLPVLGEQLALLIRRYPAYRNITLRLLEPLGAPETDAEKPERRAAVQAAQGRGEAGEISYSGVAIELKDVSVRVAGHTILASIDLTIASGSHIAIVGPSGAGKSTLVGLLLGWHRPATGQVRIDDQPLDAGRLAQLRRETAWVDPAIQLWNRSFLANLQYGSAAAAGAGTAPLTLILEQADLLNVLEKLPDGLETILGEGGGLLSGGEGQRVRLGRALLQPDARLVILDEPFRGLDREQRRQLLTRARHLWQDATLLCITHDVAETQDFDQVLVVETGRIVESGPPSHLAGQPNSRYRALLEAEEDVRQGLWSGAEWREWRLENGRLRQRNPTSKTWQTITTLSREGSNGRSTDTLLAGRTTR